MKPIAFARSATNDSPWEPIICAFVMVFVIAVSKSFADERFYEPERCDTSRIRTKHKMLRGEARPGTTRGRSELRTRASRDTSRPALQMPRRKPEVNEFPVAHRLRAAIRQSQGCESQERGPGECIRAARARARRPQPQTWSFVTNLSLESTILGGPMSSISHSEHRRNAVRRPCARSARTPWRYWASVG